MTAAKSAKTEPKKNRVDAFMLLDEAVWKIKFLKDTAINGGVDSEGSPGLTEDGATGLSLILNDVIKDIENASALFAHPNSHQ